MKQETTPNPACEKASLKVLKRVEKVVLRANGLPEKLSYWQQSTKKLEGATRIKFPVYDRIEGNVFNWIIQASEDFRKIRRRERYVEFEKATAKPKVVDSAKVEN
jgi:hypothetical protein